MAVTQVVEGGVLPRAEELETIASLLRGHVRTLMPATEAAVGRLWRGGVERWRADGHLESTRRRLESGSGDGLCSAQQHVALLARDVAWMLRLTAEPEEEAS